MNISQAGIDLITSSEGFSAHVYNDRGKMAIGYGHDLLPGESFPNGITQEQAEALLNTDLQDRFVPQTNAILATLQYTVNQNQFDALVDFCFNLGATNLHEMLRHGLNQVPTQILRWHFSGSIPVSGLLARRERELALFQAPMTA